LEQNQWLFVFRKLPFVNKTASKTVQKSGVVKKWKCFNFAKNTTRNWMKTTRNTTQRLVECTNVVLHNYSLLHKMALIFWHDTRIFSSP
jgi:hypothetical protein